MFNKDITNEEIIKIIDDNIDILMDRPSPRTLMSDIVDILKDELDLPDYLKISYYRNLIYISNKLVHYSEQTGLCFIIKTKKVVNKHKSVDYVSCSFNETKSLFKNMNDLTTSTLDLIKEKETQELLITKNFKDYVETNNLDALEFIMLLHKYSKLFSTEKVRLVDSKLLPKTTEVF